MFLHNTHKDSINGIYEHGPDWTLDCFALIGATSGTPALGECFCTDPRPSVGADSSLLCDVCGHVFLAYIDNVKLRFVVELIDHYMNTHANHETCTMSSSLTIGFSMRITYDIDDYYFMCPCSMLCLVYHTFMIIMFNYAHARHAYFLLISYVILTSMSLT